MRMKKQLWETFCEGIEEIIPEDETSQKLQNGHATIKFGADPSATDLHLGHMVILNKLRLLQDMGNTVLFLIGDFTAMIGDPTGKSATRPPLTLEDTKQNANSYKEQVFKLLNPDKTKVVYNNDWLGQLSAQDIITLSSKHTVARMLERDDFSKRYKNEIPISIHEFLYPLLQGYDSVVLKNDIEVGGTDQKFNLLVGRQLQKEANQEPQGIITFPILEGVDGKQKMSKSLNNHIGIAENPNDIYGKIMSIPDTLITRYFILLSTINPKEIKEKETAMAAGENPKHFKDELAMHIVTRLHSKEDAIAAQTHFKTVFSNKELPTEMPELKLKTQNYHLISLIDEHKLLPSKKESRRLIEQGAVSIDQNKVEDPNLRFNPKDGQVLRLGKRRFYRLVLDH